MQWVEVQGKGIGMIDSEYEMQLVMKFLDENMHLRNVKLEEMSDVQLVHNVESDT